MLEMGGERLRAQERTAIVCHSVSEYIGCLFDILDGRAPAQGAVAPLLAAASARAQLRSPSKDTIAHRAYVPSGAFARLARADESWLLAACRERTGSMKPASAACCIVAEEDPAALMGAAHALLSGKRLLVLGSDNDLAPLRDEMSAAASVTVVLSARRVASVGCDELHHFLDLPEDGRPWGLLTGSGSDRISNLVARIHLRTEPAAREGIVFGTESAERFASRDSLLTCKPLPSHPADDVAQLTGRAVPFAAFIGHGRSYCAAAGSLCSRTEGAAAGDRRCVGGFDCVFADWPRVSARELRADLFLLDSCSTSSFRLLGPEMEEGLNLAVHMLDGFASAVISPRRTNMPLPMTPLVAWALLDRGFSLGRVCAELNRLSAGRAAAPNAFTLLGDPDMRLFAPRATTTELTAREEAKGVWRLQLPASTAGVVYCECRDDQLVAQARLGAVHCLSGGAALEPTALQVVGRPEHRLGIVVARPSQSDAADLLLVTRPPFRHEVVVSAGKLLANARMNRDWLPERLEAKLQEVLWLLEPTLACNLDTPISDPSAYRAFYEAERRVVALCDELEAAMMDRLVERAREKEFWIAGHYARQRGTRRLAEVASPRACERCAATVYERRYQVGLWPARTRCVRECERCLSLSDVEDGEMELLLVGPERVAKGRPFELRIVGRNVDRAPATLRGAVVIDKMGHPSQSMSVEPNIRTLTVGPGEPFELGFEICLPEPLPVHLFHAKGLIMKEGGIGWALKKLFVRAR